MPVAVTAVLKTISARPTTTDRRSLIHAVKNAALKLAVTATDLSSQSKIWLDIHVAVLIVIVVMIAASVLAGEDMSLDRPSLRSQNVSASVLTVAACMTIFQL